jgi:hypothetical protein
MPFVGYEPPVKRGCRSREHNPPGNILLEPGTHTYQCPACGEQTKFEVLERFCMTAPVD